LRFALEGFLNVGCRCNYLVDATYNEIFNAPNDKAHGWAKKLGNPVLGNHIFAKALMGVKYDLCPRLSLKHHCVGQHLDIMKMIKVCADI